MMKIKIEKNIEENNKKNKKSSFLNIKISVNEKDLLAIMKINSSDILKIIPNPTKESLDLLYFVSYIYTIDKLVRRRWFIDNWTRDIEVSIPVSNVNLWNQAKKDLKKGLDFLTGDNWVISFEELEEEYFKIGKLDIEETKKFNKICLFSGGLDSLVGAIDLIDENESVLLISHSDGYGAVKKAQNNIYNSICESYKEKNIKLGQHHIFSNYNRKTLHEPTTRGRSILFLGLGIFYAMNLENDKVYATENGVISINLPLTQSRSSSNSTRTMHPYFLSQLEKALEKLNIDIKIENPYLYKTKGEMLNDCKNQNLLKELFKQTVSCSHSTHRRTWKRKKKRYTKNCGYCIPCLIRRASVNALGIDLDNYCQYGVDILNENEREEIISKKEDSKVPNDFKAISYFLSKNLKENDIREEIITVAPTENIDKISKMLIRGYDEIRQLISNKTIKKV